MPQPIPQDGHCKERKEYGGIEGQAFGGGDTCSAFVFYEDCQEAGSGTQGENRVNCSPRAVSLEPPEDEKRQEQKYRPNFSDGSQRLPPICQ